MKSPLRIEEGVSDFSWSCILFILTHINIMNYIFTLYGENIKTSVLMIIHHVLFFNKMKILLTFLLTCINMLNILITLISPIKLTCVMHGLFLLVEYNV